MINQITNYKELLQEKARLKTLLAEQELQIKNDWSLIKEDLRPFTHVATAARHLFTRKATVSAMQLGVNLFADGFVKKVLLGNTGWIVRTLVPFFIKNFASHITDEPEKIIHKVKNFFTKKRKKEKEPVVTEDVVVAVKVQETGMDAV